MAALVRPGPDDTALVREGVHPAEEAAMHRLLPAGPIGDRYGRRGTMLVNEDDPI